MNKNNIVLIGFMGAGKSSVGKILSQKLGLNLYDIDHVIEKREGQKISEIFLNKGEEYFRKLEKETIGELSNIENAVIVPGAGAPLNFFNAINLKKMGDIFFLDTNLNIIKKRLDKSKERPLSISKEFITGLYNFRLPIYQNLGVNIGTSELSINFICDKIIKIYLAKRKISAPENIFISLNNQEQLICFGDVVNNITNIIFCNNFEEYKKVIITSANLFILQKNIFKKLQENLSCEIVFIEDDEQYKNYNNIEFIQKKLFAKKCDRKSLLIAIGGGVVSDVAGFAASTYLRGVPLINVPTTLLAMVDSSLGGKNGINNQYGKNLIGTFYLPKAVVIEQQFLQTLPSVEFSCGMAEVIKHAIIDSEKFFYELLNGHLDINEIIKKAIEVKAKIVSEDLYEKNIRKNLNLGHTFAHAIEKVSNYKIKHGQAVSIGLVCAMRLAKNLGILKQDFLSDLINLLSKYDLPTILSENIDRKAIIEAMRYDKKREGQKLKFILPIALGNVDLFEVSSEHAFRVL